MKSSFRIIGLMSGTSLDGLDLADCRFWKEQDEWNFELITGISFQYPESLYSRLFSSPTIDQTGLNKLDYEFGIWCGSRVSEYLSTLKELPDFISSHGHTVFHDPKNGISIQVGSGQTMADITAMPVINDFRIGDVQLGGQGAPLVPIGDKFLFSEYPICVNIGGICNISKKEEDRIIAYDLGMANVAFNYLAKENGQAYDKDGLLGSEGSIDTELLENFKSLDYFRQDPPKSLDANFFQKKILPLIELKSVEIKDSLRTLYELLAIQLAEVCDSESTLFTGGGSLNQYLMKLIKDKGVKVTIPDKEIVEFKEAIIFAFMGLLNYMDEVNILSSVTGASADSKGGIWHYPSNIETLKQPS